MAIQIVLSPTLPPALVDPVDYPLVSRFKWHAIKTTPKSKTHYVATYLSKKPIFLHRLILNPLPGMEVDHKNGNGLDNRRVNLRICTIAENRQNTSGWAKRKCLYKGVSRVKKTTGNKGGKCWEARICYGGKQRAKSFFTAEQAARYYDEQARIHHGKFARLNFPNPGERGLL